MGNENHDAPGAPGIEPRWTSSSKSGIAKSLNSASDISLTISHGILNEVYYPREDIACIRDMGLLVTDGEGFFCEEKRNTHHDTQMVKPGIPAYLIKNTDPENRFEIKKEITPDPSRNTVLQRIRFSQNQEDITYHIYALLAPHINNQGRGNTGWVAEYKGVPMVFAQNGDITLALACSSKFLKRSAGYVGVSDGWTDINRHKKMAWEYPFAKNGNIALTAEIDITDKKDFVLALSFGRNPAEAANHARSSLLDGFEKAKKEYIKEWTQWQKTLKKEHSKNYKISAAVLRIHEANSFKGGIIASLSIPWGDSVADKVTSGYHLVWPRDLVMSSGGFLALGATDDVARILNYLMATQNGDGSWPQNMWLQGEPNWQGVQMDQIALPLIEVHNAFERKAIDKKRMARYWPLAKKAILFLLKNGGYTEQDRWEEERGYTPFTIATGITGLLAGSALAEINGDKRLAIFCKETADNWNDAIESQLYVTGTQLAKDHGVEGYYIRINPYKNISAKDLGDRTIDLKNHKFGEGRIRLNELVSVDALALVRFGLRAADDPRIRNTLKIIDALLKVETPNGACWHRYNNDGYGEHENGDPYDGTGIGRAWPLLSGERAHYEIAAGNIVGAKKLLEAMDRFSNCGLIPEQIWDTDDIPEKRLFLGKHTGSAMPLTWANAEYLKLCNSIDEKKVFDMPIYTQERYIKKKTKCDFEIWRFDDQLEVLPKGKFLRIEVLTMAQIVWSDDGWKSNHTTHTTDIGVGMFIADMKKVNPNAKKIEFTFYWEDANKWENKRFGVDITTV